MNTQDAYMLRIAALDNLAPAQEAYRTALFDDYHANSLWLQHHQDDMYYAWVETTQRMLAAFRAMTDEEKQVFRVG